MTTTSENLGIVSPKNQLILYGYEYYINSFIKLYKKNKFPNTILLSGPKGSGKATFAYHFINYLLSYNELNKYSVDKMTINPKNNSYKSLCNYTNHNFSLLENDDLDENIKIEKVRNILKFLSKSTYSSNIKIVLIDNAEYLNAHSSNALLKVLEESNNRTFFFIIHNNSNKIINTIKSRCIEFKIFFSLSKKKQILENIIRRYKDNLDIKSVDDSFYFDSPGNILKYLLIIDDSEIDLLKNRRSCIFYLIEKYREKNDPELLTFISLLIQLFYNELSFKNNKNLNIYAFNQLKLLKQINDTKKFNLDKKNLLTSLIGTIENE